MQCCALFEFTIQGLSKKHYAGQTKPIPKSCGLMHCIALLCSAAVKCNAKCALTAAADAAAAAVNNSCSEFAEIFKVAFSCF